MPARRLLLLSNSTDPSGAYLQWAYDELLGHLGGAGGDLAFVPFAGVGIAWDAYAGKVRAAFAELGWRVTSVHEVDDPAALVRAADAVAVGGGNTFHLLRELYRTRLLDVVRERALAGAPYVGWSAGSVVACPTIRTTNDMPIVEPPSLDAMGLVRCQINAHYTDFHPPGFRGETRRQRLDEFVIANPGVPVLGLPEGTLLRVRDGSLRVVGTPTSAEHAPVLGVAGVDRAGLGEPLPFPA